VDINISDLTDDTDKSDNYLLGVLTNILITVYFKINTPKAGEKIKNEFKERLEKLLQLKDNFKKYIIETLVSYLNSLFLIDSDWTEKNLIYLFNWNNEELSFFAWKGLLNCSKFNFEVIFRLKDYLLKSFNYYERFKGAKNYMVNFFVFTTIEFSSENRKLYKDKEVRDILKLDNNEIRETVLQYIQNRLRNNNPDEIWEKEIKNWINKYWPKDAKFKTTELNNSFINIIFLLDKYFQEATNILIKFIKIDNNDKYHSIWYMYDIEEKITKYPNEILIILKNTYSKRIDMHSMEELKKNLVKIKENDINILNNENFIYLAEKLKKKGIEIG
ncbi:MAG: hypothetical protein KA885_09795, partial [Spirochaetes bacterium]|nr:hypothetical protein [Spirochaetota bacterium]